MLGDPVAELSDLAQRPSVELALAAMRDHLEMDVAFVTEIAAGERSTLRALDGDAALASTAVEDDGATISAPLRFSDGRLFGMLCAANRGSRPRLRSRDLQFLQVVARIVADQLEREDVEQLARHLQSQAAAVTALRAAVAARDRYTAEHSEAVVEHAVAVGRLLGLDGGALVDLARVALLHDIGKIAIPDGILHKQGSLSPDEWIVMRTHPVSSQQLIASVPDLAHLAPAIRSEHERWDGAGYPDGIGGDAIPLAARITLVCDAYHAMVSDRPYREALSRDEALAEIEDKTGTQFCPTAAGALLRLLRADR